MNLAVLPDDAVLDNDQSASASAPDPSATPAPVAAQPGLSTDAIRSYIHATLTDPNLGDAAKRKKIDDFVATYSHTPVDPGSMEAGLKNPNIPISVGSLAKSEPQPKSPSGLVELPDDAQLDHEPETGFLHNAAVAGRGVVQGLGDLGQYVDPTHGIFNKITGIPTAGEYLDNLAEKHDIGTAQTPGQHVLQSAARGAASAGPFGVEGGLGATALAALSGASGGGAGEGVKQAGGNTAEQIAASLIAGGVPSLVAGGVNAVRNAVSPAIVDGVMTDGQRAAAAAQRLSEGPFTGEQGFVPFAGDVGGTAVRKMVAGVAQTPFGSAPIVEAAQNVAEQGKGVRDAVASSIGQILNPELAGNTATQGARSFISRTSQEARALYGKADAAAKGVQIVPTKAIEAADKNIAELSENVEGGPALERLKGLRDALAKGGFTTQGIRNTRTALRDEFMGNGLRGSDTERRMNQILDAANEDITNGLKAAGRPEAAQAYRVADRYWKARVSTIDDTLAPIIGKDGDASGEEVVKKLQSAMAGNNDRFVKFMKALPEHERNDVRASLISRLGRSTKGNQNDESNAFSLSTFVSNWTDDALGARAKAQLFGPEARAALNDLAAVANGAKQSIKFANHSNTAGAMEAGRLLTYITALPTLGGSVVGQYTIGRLLAAPAFARWLARAPRTALSQPAYIDRLSRIAAAQPAISTELRNLQSQLLSGINNGNAKLAAQEPDNESSGVDR